MLSYIFFFFKEKKGNRFGEGSVGSENCIRDRAGWRTMISGKKKNRGIFFSRVPSPVGGKRFPRKKKNRGIFFSRALSPVGGHRFPRKKKIAEFFFLEYSVRLADIDFREKKKLGDFFFLRN